PEAPIIAQVHQPIDIHRDLTAQIAFDDVVLLDRLADLDGLGVRQFVDAALGRNTDLFRDLGGLLRPDPMDILQRDDYALVRRDIDASNASQVLLSFIRPMAARPDRSTTTDRTPLPHQNRGNRIQPK